MDSVLANAISCAFEGQCNISLWSLPIPWDQKRHSRTENLPLKQQLYTGKD